MMKILYCGLVTEAIIYILFSAAPALWLRSIIIKKTPWLYSSRKKQHLLDCPTCTGFWVCAGAFAILTFAATPAVSAFFSFIIAYRCFTLLRDIFTGLFNLVVNLIVWRTKR